MSANIFEQASRKKVRFNTPKGELTVEQMWDLPLTSAVENKANLDATARVVNRELRSISEDSFVETVPNARKELLELQLEILKYMIATRKAENEAVKLKAEKKAELDRLSEILLNKKDQELSNLSVEQIEQRMAALRA